MSYDPKTEELEFLPVGELSDFEKFADYLIPFSSKSRTYDFNLTLLRWMVRTIDKAQRGDKRKVDKLVIEGPQASGKSTFLKKAIIKAVEDFAFVETTNDPFFVKDDAFFLRIKSIQLDKIDPETVTLAWGFALHCWVCDNADMANY